MAYYMFQVALTPEAWANLARNPQDREEALRPVLERLGGKLVCGYLSFGEYDSVTIASFPDNVSAASWAVALAAGGAAKAVKTTTLMTIGEEGVEIMRRAGTAGYRPPSS